jgi:hypothetical protein
MTGARVAGAGFIGDDGHAENLTTDGTDEHGFFEALHLNIQAPEKFQAPNFNRWPQVNWCLVFEDSLELGAWGLVLQSRFYFAIAQCCFKLKRIKE